MTRSPTFKTAALIWPIFWERALRAARESKNWKSTRTPAKESHSFDFFSHALASALAVAKPKRRLRIKTLPLAHLTAAVAAPDVAGHDAPDAGDRRRRVRRRRHLVDLFLARQQGADRRLELLARGRLLSHFVSFNRRFAVPLTIRHSVRAMMIAASTTTIRYGNPRQRAVEDLELVLEEPQGPEEQEEVTEADQEAPRAPQATKRPMSLIGWIVSSLM